MKNNVCFLNRQFHTSGEGTVVVWLSQWQLQWQSQVFHSFFGFAMTLKLAGEVSAFDVAVLVEQAFLIVLLGCILVMIMWCHCIILTA